MRPLLDEGLGTVEALVFAALSTSQPRLYFLWGAIFWRVLLEGLECFSHFFLLPCFLERGIGRSRFGLQAQQHEAESDVIEFERHHGEGWFGICFTMERSGPSHRPQQGHTHTRTSNPPKPPES